MIVQASIGANLRRFRKRSGLSQARLGAAVGVSGQVVLNWEKGVTPIPGADLFAVADALGVDVWDLRGEASGDPRRDAAGRPPDSRKTAQLVATLRELLETAPAEGKRIEINVLGPPGDLTSLEAELIPVYGWGSCGPIGEEGGPEPIDREPAPEGADELGPHPLAVRVRGDSMCSRGICDGDTVYVRRQANAQSGDVVLARVWDSDGSEMGMVVKEVNGDLGTKLWSNGSEGRVPFPVSRYDIVGRVVYVRAGLRRPLSVRDGTHARPERRDRVALDEVERMIAALPAHQQRELFKRWAPPEGDLAF